MNTRKQQHKNLQHCKASKILSWNQTYYSFYFQNLTHSLKHFWRHYALSSNSIISIQFGCAITSNTLNYSIWRKGCKKGCSLCIDSVRNNIRFYGTQRKMMHKNAHVQVVDFCECNKQYRKMLIVDNIGLHFSDTFQHTFQYLANEIPTKIYSLSSFLCQILRYYSRSITMTS